MSKPQIGVVLRHFTAKAGREVDGAIVELDMDKFMQKSRKLVDLVTGSGLIDHGMVVSCTDPSVKWGEAVDDNGHTPTWRAYCKAYPELVEGGQLKVVFVDNWGPNAGSGQGVQAGVDAVLAAGLPYSMAWSNELAVTPDLLAKAMGLLDHYNLDGIGFLRENCIKKPQWMFPQHTGFIGTKACWGLAKIPTYADGIEGIKVDTEVGPANLAGMDDAARFFEALKVKPDLRLGMYGWENPLAWTIDFTDKRQVEKISRQWAVAKEWAKRSFPDTDPETTIIQFIERNVKML